MAGKRKSKSGGSQEAFFDILILLAVGLIISYWQIVLVFLVIVTVASGIYLVLKQIKKKVAEKKVGCPVDQHLTPPDIGPRWGMSKYELEKLDDAELAEVIAVRKIVAKLDAIAQVNQRLQEQELEMLPKDVGMVSNSLPIPQQVLQVEDRQHQNFIPRPVPMKSEDIEAKLRKLEEIIKE